MAEKLSITTARRVIPAGLSLSVLFAGGFAGSYAAGRWVPLADAVAVKPVLMPCVLYHMQHDAEGERDTDAMLRHLRSCLPAYPEPADPSPLLRS